MLPGARRRHPVLGHEAQPLALAWFAPAERAPFQEPRAEGFSVTATGRRTGGGRVTRMAHEFVAWRRVLTWR
jgi:hypothetical protein